MGSRTTKYVVMLAHPFKDNKVVYPCIVQPKYDGIRCRAVIKDHTVQLLSRDNKEILSMDHIKDALKHLDDIELDGELYDHSLEFQVLNGIIRRHTSDELSLQIRFMVYDFIDISQDYKARYNYLCTTVLSNVSMAIKLVDNYIADTKEDIERLHDQFVADGYEGAMVRTHVIDRKGTVSYVGYQSEALTGQRRSWSLLKYKIFQDEEFTIAGVEEEIDLAGKAKSRTGAFIMEMDNGKRFRASGIRDDIKIASWISPENYIGKKATIKFFGTSVEGIPRFPSFKDVRWDE